MNKLLPGMAVLPFLAGAASAATPVPPGGPACPVSLEYVLGTDHNLWREYSDRSTQFNVGHRLLVAQDVAQFQALWCSNVVYVLKTDGTLWQAPPIPNTSNAQPTKIDADVLKFQIMGDGTAYVLHTDWTLSLEYTDHRSYPPPFSVDDNVVQFQGIGSNVVYVLEADGNLWHVGDQLYLVDRNVLDFQVDTHGNVYVLYSDRSLHRRYTNGKSPDRVDGNVLAFQALDETYVYVLGTDGKLWREIGNYSNRGPGPVAQSVRGFQALDPARVDILGADRELRNNLASTDIDANVLQFQNDQAPFQATGIQLLRGSLCPPQTVVTQSSPNPSPPCIPPDPTISSDRTSANVTWTTSAYRPNCDHPGDGNICTWDFLTTYDAYNVKYGLLKDYPNWKQIPENGEFRRPQSSTVLPNLVPGQPYGVIIEGSLFCEDIDFLHKCTDWTSWSEIQPFMP